MERLQERRALLQAVLTPVPLPPGLDVGIGLRCFPPYRELFHHHLGERIVKRAEGHTVWVVE